MLKYCPHCGETTRDLQMAYCRHDRAVLVRDPLVGRRVAGRFDVLDRIGAGNMGVVYRARQRSVDRDVALKVLTPALVHGANAVRRFSDEVRAIAAVEHPNTVAVYDFGETDDGLLYLVMELVWGRRLSELLAADGALDPARACRIVAQICDSVAAAHRQGVLHRDLKPDNIMVTQRSDESDAVKVLDFGLASVMGSGPRAVTGGGCVDGTPEYMSPEVATGGAADARSDLYSIATILYELLSGRPPFWGDDGRAVMESQVFDAIPALPAALPPHLRALTLQALAKDPAARPVSVVAFRARLMPPGHGAPTGAITIRGRHSGARIRRPNQGQRPRLRETSRRPPARSKPVEMPPPPKRRRVKRARGTWRSLGLGAGLMLLVLALLWLLRADRVSMGAVVPDTWEAPVSVSGAGGPSPGPKRPTN